MNVKKKIKDKEESKRRKGKGRDRMDRSCDECVAVEQEGGVHGAIQNKIKTLILAGHSGSHSSPSR